MSETLTTKQQRAIAALLTSRTVAQAARAANVGERTLQRWLTDDRFKLALLAAEGEVIDTATRRLVGLSDTAIGALTDVMADPQTPAGVKVRSAQAVLDYLLRLRDLRNVESRLTRLEANLGKDDDTQQTDEA